MKKLPVHGTTNKIQCYNKKNAMDQKKPPPNMTNKNNLSWNIQTSTHVMRKNKISSRERHNVHRWEKTTNIKHKHWNINNYIYKNFFTFFLSSKYMYMYLGTNEYGTNYNLFL